MMSVILTLSAAKGKDLTLSRTRSFAVFAAQDDGTRCAGIPTIRLLLSRPFRIVLQNNRGGMAAALQKRSSFEC
jgi:hypothetical protein